jgi:hypothetical protein
MENLYLPIPIPVGEIYSFGKRSLYDKYKLSAETLNVAFSYRYKGKRKLLSIQFPCPKAMNIAFNFIATPCLNSPF